MSATPNRLSDLLADARQLLAETAHLAPGTLHRIDENTGMFLTFADHHGLGRGLSQLDAVDLAAFIYDRLHHRRVKLQSAYKYTYSVARSWRQQTGSRDAIETLAMQVIADAKRESPGEAPQQAAVIPLWLLHEMLGQIRVGMDGYDPRARGLEAARWRVARDRALLGVLFGAALRPSEALEASVDQVRRTHCGGQLRLLISKNNQTGQRNESVTIADDDLLGSGRLLAEWLEVRGDLPDDGLFPGSDDGIPLSPRSASTRLRRAAHRCGHTDGAISLGSLRRTRATLELQAHGDVENVRRLLRHGSAGMTSRYLDPLRHLAADPTAIEGYLATRRPDGVDANGLGSGTPTAAKRSDAADQQDTLPQVPIARLREQALAAAERGADPLDPTTRRERRRIGASWREFCTTHGLDPAEASAEDLGAFVVSERRRGLTATTLHTYLSHLTQNTVSTEGAVPPPSGQARRIVEAYRREDADRPARHSRGTALPRRRLIELLDRTNVDPADTASLDRALLRRQLTAGGAETAGTMLADDDVDMATDGTHAKVAVAGRHVVLRREANPLLCPVRALRRLRAGAPDGILVSRWKLNAGALHARGLHTRVEDWTEAEWQRAVWVLSTSVRKSLRLQLVVSLVWAGPLFAGDLRRARLEHLTRDEYGYLLHLPADRAEGLTLRLAPTEDRLCPVRALDRWRSLWPHQAGPLVPAIIDHRAPEADPDSRQLIPGKSFLSETLRPLTTPVDTPLTVETIVAARIAEEWDAHGALAHVRRLLRHQQFDTTLAYLQRHGLPTSDPTSRMSAASTQPDSGAEPHQT